MAEKLHSEMHALKKDILDMGNLARDMLKRAMIGLSNHDEEMTQWVVSQKERLADFDQQIERRCLTLIALYQPMAKDLRTIATALKMNTYLYRIGRYGKDIAILEPEFDGMNHIASFMSIAHMADVVDNMIRDTLTAFKTEKIDLLRDIEERDNVVDALRYSIFRECLTYMMEDPKHITPCTNYVMIARYLERCGDHACKIAEKVHYMITGERIEIK